MSAFIELYRRIKHFLIPYYVRFWIYPQWMRTCRKKQRSIHKKGTANVVFLASCLAMWKYQGLYDLMRKNRRFNATIILVPFKTFSLLEKENNINELAGYFDARGIPYYKFQDIHNPGRWFYNEIRPDLIFYPQPYDNLYDNELDYSHNLYSLLAYVPYGALTLRESWIYNTTFINKAWRVYYQSSYNKKLARIIANNKGKNVRISGYISTDDFKIVPQNNNHIWKPQGKPKIKIIWAPHFSGIVQPSLLKRGSFKWLCTFMQTLAQTHKDTIQIAFKPHPKLLSTLYESSDWGKEKTDAYYAWWTEGENTQLETGQFISLFQTSDAMIHDCNSFIADYLLTGKPVLFTTSDLQQTEEQLDDFGKAALHAHYLGMTTQDVLNFVRNLENGAPDSKAAERQSIIQKHLLPPNGKTAAENIYDDLLKAFRFKHE